MYSISKEKFLSIKKYINLQQLNIIALYLRMNGIVMINNKSYQ